MWPTHLHPGRLLSEASLPTTTTLLLMIELNWPDHYLLNVPLSVSARLAADKSVVIWGHGEERSL